MRDLEKAILLSGGRGRAACQAYCQRGERGGTSISVTQEGGKGVSHSSVEPEYSTIIKRSLSLWKEP